MVDPKVTKVSLFTVFQPLPRWGWLTSKFYGVPVPRVPQVFYGVPVPRYPGFHVPARAQVGLVCVCVYAARTCICTRVRASVHVYMCVHARPSLHARVRASVYLHTHACAYVCSVHARMYRVRACMRVPVYGWCVSAMFILPQRLAQILLAQPGDLVCHHSGLACHHLGLACHHPVQNKNWCINTQQYVWRATTQL